MQLALVGASCVMGGAVRVNPIEKVVQLMDDLTAKITKEGQVEAKAFKEFVEWCDDAASNAKFAQKTASAQQGKLEATIDQATADKAVAVSQIEDLGKSIASSESELADATAIREKEHADFAAIESELVDTVDTLDRAIMMLEREMAKNPAMLQKTVNTANVKEMLQVLNVVISSAGVASNDRQKLVALVQDQQTDDDDDLGAPDAAAYKSQSSSIVDILEDMKEKAEAELAEARKSEGGAAHNFAMLKQSLEDQIKADTKDMNGAKANKAAADETSATATGDLAITIKDLENAKDNLATVGSDCMTSAADHEATVNGRAEELKALAVAKKAIVESTGGATEKQYSFLQIVAASDNGYNTGTGLRTGSDLVNFEIINVVKRLAKEHHSAALNQLASRINAVVRYGSASGEDPFAKVKSLITDMLTKLEEDAQADASHKAYCDEEMAKTADKKEELSNAVEKLVTKIDKAASMSAKLKEESAGLQAELSAMAKAQYEMDAARQDESTAFKTAKADLEAGVAGIQKALQVLRDYYGSASLLQGDDDFDMMSSLVQQPAAPAAHSKSSGAGGTIIGMLEVVESDFSKTLTEETVAEDQAQASYDQQTQSNKITKTMNEQDIKYKTAESKSLDKSVAEYGSDKGGLDTQLAAVLEYSEKLDAQCIAKPETYEERAKRRVAEIDGLKEALQVLEEQTAFVQKKGKGRGLRILRAH